MADRARETPSEIRIANSATYWPMAPIDAVLAAPLAARLLLGATPAGRLVQVAVLGAYFGSALQDWVARRGVRRIDFLRVFGADVRHLTPMPQAVREEEVQELSERLNDGFTPERIPRRELAVEVDRHLTCYIAGITGQRVETSAEIRGFCFAGVMFPFALGACDFLSGDVALFRDVGIFEPHVIAHEFCHRKGYWKELEAQALAYLSLTASDNPVLVQSARCERLHRNLRVLSREQRVPFKALADRSGLRAELRSQLVALVDGPAAGPVAKQLELAMRRLYDERMRLTGQNGISDYDEGFTNFLYTYERRTAALTGPH